MYAITKMLVKSHDLKDLNPSSMTRTATTSLKFAIYVALVSVVYFNLTSQAYAAASPLTQVLCIILVMVQGNLARGLATAAVIMLGASAIFGKVSWGMALTIVIGISMMFLATKIAFSLGIVSPC